MNNIKTVYGKEDNALFQVEEGLMATVTKEFFYNGESWYNLHTDNDEDIESPSIFWEDERDTSKENDTMIVELAYEVEKDTITLIVNGEVICFDDSVNATEHFLAYVTGGKPVSKKDKLDKFSALDILQNYASMAKDYKSFSSAQEIKEYADAIKEHFIIGEKFFSKMVEDVEKGKELLSQISFEV